MRNNQKNYLSISRYPTYGKFSLYHSASTEFWLAEASPAHANFSPLQLGGGSIRLVLTVTDPDSTYQKALSAGARQICPPTDDNGWRVGRLEDPYGPHWEIARPL